MTTKVDSTKGINDLDQISFRHKINIQIQNAKININTSNKQKQQSVIINSQKEKLMEMLNKT